MQLYVNLAFVGQMIEDIRAVLEILGPGLFFSGIGLWMFYQMVIGWQRNRAQIALIKAQADAQLKISEQQTEANQVATIADLAKGLMSLFTELTKTLQVMQSDVKTTAGIAPQAREHYAAASAHHDATLVHQRLIEPMLVNIKTVVDRTDLKVGELTSLISLLSTLNTAADEIKSVTSDLNVRIVSYLERDKATESKPEPGTVNEPGELQNSPAIPEPPVVADESRADVVANEPGVQS